MEKQRYVAEFLNKKREGEWNQSGQLYPRFTFRANSDDEALSLALHFEKNPTEYNEKRKRRMPMDNVKYELTKLYQMNEIALIKLKHKKGLESKLERDDFRPF